MTFDPSQPQDLPPPNTGIQSVQENFSQYGTVFDNNHVALNARNQGKHTNVILQQQGIDPVIEGNYDTLFIKPVAAAFNTSQQLFSKIPQFLPIDKPNDATQMTFNIVNTTGPAQYQSFLPGGYILYFGVIPSASPSINATITLIPAPREIVCVIPNPTKFGTVGLGTISRPVTVAVTVLNASQFRVNATFPTLGTGDVKWICIAKQ